MKYERNEVPRTICILVDWYYINILKKYDDINPIL